MTFNLKTYLKEYQLLVDKTLLELLPATSAFPSKLFEAMHYSIFAGGKRIRPILCMASAEACGGRKEGVLALACALEMIHTFSLIHDDLPAMDDDNFRRGMPTNHRVFGEAVAVLAGDALLAEAFVVLGKMKNKVENCERLLEVMQDIALATGSAGMIAGQVVDIGSEGKKLDLDELKRLHHLKTGQLICAAIMSGAKMATDDLKKLRSLQAYGEAVGLAFQIADDVLDIEGGEELGKDIGSDVENNKATYPQLLGLQGAKEEAQQQCQAAVAALNNFGTEADPLRAIATYVIERKK